MVHISAFSPSLYLALMKAVTKEVCVTDESLIALFLNILEIVPTHGRHTKCTFLIFKIPTHSDMVDGVGFFLSFFFLQEI